MWSITIILEAQAEDITKKYRRVAPDKAGVISATALITSTTLEAVLVLIVR
jgi:hypothetical protein